MKHHERLTGFQQGQDHIGDLELLVNELIKDRPDTSRVKTFMQRVGLAYSSDPVECMNRAMKALNGPGRQRRLDRDHGQNP